MRCLALVAVVCAVGTSAFPAAAADRVEPAGGALGGNRYRVVVSSDIGGSDPDDFQSMVHYLFEQHPDLWLIESNTTFRGMYMGGKQDGDLGNTAFVRQHVQGHGALGEFFVQKKADIKMGDTPSVLYLLRGDPAFPESPHWGGQFVKTAHGPHYWTDDPSPENADAGRPGGKTVSRWREPYLRDWQQRLDRMLPQK